MREIIQNVPKSDTGVEFIGDQAYRFRAVLFDNEGNLIPLRKDAFERIEIEDNILNWYHYGYVDIKNPYDVLERASIGKNARDALVEIEKFQMRNDGTLNLYLSLEPQIRDSEITGFESISDDDLTMEFIFSVYRVEDPPTESVENKIKRLYVKDYRQFFLETHQSYYSTSDTAKKIDKNIKRISHLQDDDTEVFTGDAIKDFLQTALFSLTDIKFGKTFDTGEYTINYSSPAEYYGADDLEYLLGTHLSTSDTSNCACLLKCNRFVKDNQFFLIPILSLYDHIYDESSNVAKGLLTERFIISNPNSRGEENYSTQKLPQRSNMPFSLYTFPEYSVIVNYTYHDIQPELNKTTMCSTIGHSYDSQHKQFSMVKRSGNINNVHEFFKQNIVRKHPVSNDTRGKPSWDLNERNKNNETVHHEYYTSTELDKISARTRDSIINNSIFNGRTVGFTCKGLTTRQSMRFIGLQRDSSTTTNHLDNKLLGVWLTTKVRHIIEPVNGYTNQIIASKQYDYENFI